MRILIFIILVLSAQYTFSQAVNELLEQEWRILPGLSNKNAWIESATRATGMTQSSASSPGNKIILSPNEQVLMVAYDKKTYGVMLMNSSLKIKWKREIKGFPVCIAKFKGKILVVHIPLFEPGTRENRFDGTLIDPANGKIITTQLLYKDAEDVVVEPKFLLHPATEEFYLALRHTALEKKIKVAFFGIGMDKYKRQILETTKMELISLDENLNPIKTIDLPCKKALGFFSMDMNVNGEVIIFYKEEDGAVGIQQIDKTFTKEIRYKTMNFDLRKRSTYDVEFSLSRQDADQVYILLKYDNEDKDRSFAIYRVNLRDNTTINNTELVNKAYARSLTDKHVRLNDDMPKPTRSEWETFDWTGAQEYGDMLVSFKEVQNTNTGYSGGAGGSSRGTSTNTGDGILTLYNKNLEIIDQQVIPKNLKISGSSAAYSFFQIHGDKVIIISSTRTGMFAYNSLIIEYDLKAKKLLRYYLPDRGGVKKGKLADPPSTIWFEKGYALNYLSDGAGGLAFRTRTDMQFFNY